MYFLKKTNNNNIMNMNIINNYDSDNSDDIELLDNFYNNNIENNIENNEKKIEKKNLKNNLKNNFINIILHIFMHMTLLSLLEPIFFLNMQAKWKRRFLLIKFIV